MTILMKEAQSKDLPSKCKEVKIYPPNMQKSEGLPANYVCTFSIKFFNNEVGDIYRKISYAVTEN